MEQLRKIAQVLDWPVEAFEAQIRPVFIRFTGLVQQLPGAMDNLPNTADTLALDSGLQDVLTALIVNQPPARKSPLPIYSAADVQYALITAVLLKRTESVIIQQSVILFDHRGQSLGIWNPLTGPMLEVENAVYHHPIPMHRKPLPGLSLVLAPALMPANELFALFQQEALSKRWRRILIEDDPIDTLGALLRAVESGPSETITLGKFPEKNMSTVESMPVTSSRPAFPVLREALLVGLQSLLATDRESALNTPNGFGWRVGEHLYLIGKVIAQKLREQPVLEPYQTLIEQNASLYQLLVDQRIALPAADKPIFNVRITDGTRERKAAVLKLPLSLLWPEERTWPVPFAGMVNEKNQHRGSKHLPR